MGFCSRGVSFQALVSAMETRRDNRIRESNRNYLGVVMFLLFIQSRYSNTSANGNVAYKVHPLPTCDTRSAIPL